MRPDGFRANAQRLMLAILLSAGLMSCSGLDTSERVNLNTSWRVNMNGSANGSEFGRAVAIDKGHNVIAAGFTVNRATGHDFTVAKFAAADGTELWRTMIDRTGSDEPSSVAEHANHVAVDPANNVFAAGGTVISGRKTDFTVVKLDGEHGRELWRQVLGRGIAQALVVDPDGNAAVAGSINDADLRDHFTVIKLDGTTGAKLWIQDSGYGVAGAIASDFRGNVVAAGLAVHGTRAGFGVAKFDAEGGAELWRRVIDGNAHAGGWAASVVVDSSGNVVAAGWLTNSGTQDDFFIVKLNGVDGSEIWRKVLNGAANGRDQALAVTLDAMGNVIGAGFIVDGANDDFFVAKFDGITGRELWRQVINGKTNGPDFAQAVKVDADGNVVAAGSLKNLFQNGDFAIVKLDGLTGKLLWQREIGGSADGIESAFALALDSFGNIAAVGRTEDSRTGDDFTVLKLPGN